MNKFVVDQFSYVQDTGTANTYAVNVGTGITAYTAGLTIRFKATNANTGASTLNVNGLGAVSIRKNVSTTLASGDILAGQIITVRHDGTNFQISGGSSGSSGTSGNTGANGSSGTSGNTGSSGSSGNSGSSGSSGNSGSSGTAGSSGVSPTDTHATLTYGATTDIDFNSGYTFRSLTLTGNVTFTTSNKALMKSVTIRIIPGASQRTFTFPASWVWMGTAPANIAANKVGILSLTCFGTAETDVVAAYNVQG